MKFIDEKGRLFGKINLIDLLVIVLLLAVVCAVLWETVGKRASEAANTQSLRASYTVRCEEVPKEICDFAAEKQKFCPKIILMSPPEIGENISKLTFGDHFDDSAITRSKEFPACYKAVADRNGCIFLDAAQAAKPSEEDALHLMPEEHKSLAESVYACIKENQI